MTNSTPQEKTLTNVELDDSGVTPSQRLVEYFLIITSKPRLTSDQSYSSVGSPGIESPNSTFDENDIDYILEISDRYPSKDYADNPLNEESVMPFVSAHCQHSASNANVVYSQEEFQLPKIHHFICTGQKGQYVYGTVLTMFEAVVPSSSSSNGPLEDGANSQYYVPKCLVLLSQHGYFLEFREFLTSMFRISTMTSSLPIERYITNFCSEISRPDPGAYSVQYTPSTFPTPLVFTTPPHNLPLTLCPRSDSLSINDPILTLFRVLGVENVVQVWVALTLERQILLVSSSVSLLTLVGEALLSLLYPLTWSHVYIPLLPQIATTILSAPVPYFCGVHRDVLPSALMDMSQETIIVDIDYDTLTIGPSTPDLPPFPHSRKNKLFNALNDVIHELHLDENNEATVANDADTSRIHRVAKYDEAFSPPIEDLNLSQGVQTPIERIAEAFFRFFASLLQNYRSYLIFPNKDTPEYMGFRTRQFILSQKFDFQPFLRQLCGTQQFDTFITKRLYTPSALDVVFFDECIKNKLDSRKSSSRLQFFKKNTTHKSWICVKEEMKEKRTIVGLEPNDRGLNGKIFSHTSFPESLNGELFGEIRGELHKSASFRNIKSEGSSKKHVSVELQKGNKTNPAVATFTLFFMAYTTIIGEQNSQISAISFKDVSPEKKKEQKSKVDEVEASLQSLEAEVAPLRKELKRDFSDPPPPKPLSPVRKQNAEELKAQARAQLGLAFHILRYLRYSLRHKADALTYRCLMNACGKVGDTSLGTTLMTLMHEDGCVVETDMYQTLVAAFSVKNVLGRGDQEAILLPEWANGATKEMDWNKLRRKNYIEMALNYATKGHASLVAAEESQSNKGDDNTVSDLDDSSESGSPVKRAGLIDRFKHSQRMESKTRTSFLHDDSRDREIGLSLSTSSANFEDDNTLPEPILVQVILGENLLETLYPDITIETDHETCPQCTTNLGEDDIIAGWTSDENDYTTKCHNCGRKFVARFSVTSTSPTFVGSRGPTSPLYCEFLSPWTLQKEIARIIEDSSNGVSSFLDPNWRNEPERATLWWNLVVAFMRYRLPISFLLQGDFSNQLITAMP